MEIDIIYHIIGSKRLSNKINLKKLFLNNGRYIITKVNPKINIVSGNDNIKDIGYNIYSKNIIIVGAI